MKLVFTDQKDVENPLGKLRFGCNPLQHLGGAGGLPSMRVRCVVRRADSSYQVYGVAGGVDAPRRFYRARTVDGMYYEQSELTHTTGPGGWLTEFDIVHDEPRNRLIAYLWKRGEGGHGVWAVGSDDGGSTWRLLRNRPLYRDHDAFGVMWDGRRGEFVCYNTTYQRWKKIFPDNIGGDRRRVLHIRTSRNGLDWEPGDDVPGSGPYPPPEELIAPDGDDPPEIEFYRFKAFPYADRYAGMMLVYAPSPEEVNPRFPWSRHGPHCYSEWWVSRDGRNWDRPFRDCFASGPAPSIVEHAPMTIGGRHLWIIDGGVYGLPEDRLFYAGARSNAAFSTRPFEMTAEPLLLNAAMQFSPHGAGMFDQAYIMAELVDPEHRTIPGYEREKCVFREMPAFRSRLKWGRLDGTELAGRSVRLRFYLRDARIHAVGSACCRGMERNEVFQAGI